MTGEPGAKGAPHRLTDEELDSRLHDLGVLAWAGEHLRELRRSVPSSGSSLEPGDRLSCSPTWTGGEAISNEQ